MKKDSRTSQRSKKSKQLVYVLLPFVLPLCLIAIGILLMVNETLIDKLFLGLGILGALIGLVEVVIYASRRKYEVQPQYLVNGIIWLVVGAALILIPFTINRFIPVLISLCVIASGISGVMNTLTFRKEGYHLCSRTVRRHQHCSRRIPLHLCDVDQQERRLFRHRHSPHHQRCHPHRQRDSGTDFCSQGSAGCGNLLY